VYKLKYRYLYHYLLGVLQRSIRSFPLPLRPTSEQWPAKPRQLRLTNTNSNKPGSNQDDVHNCKGKKGPLKYQNRFGKNSISQGYFIIFILKVLIFKEKILIFKVKILVLKDKNL
jgi:hypothetical protein